MKEIVLNNGDGLHPISQRDLRAKTEVSQRGKNSVGHDHSIKPHLSLQNDGLSYGFSCANPTSHKPIP